MNKLTSVPIHRIDMPRALQSAASAGVGIMAPDGTPALAAASTTASTAAENTAEVLQLYFYF